MPLSNTDDFQVRPIGGKGVGLFAARRFAKGEGIYRFDYWSAAEMPIHATNHSCDPNASFDAEGMLRAARQIEAGDEITFDYIAHPIPASPWNFKCECGAKNCVGWIDVGSRQDE